MPNNDNYKLKNNLAKFLPSLFQSFYGWFTHIENIAICAIAAITFILHLLTISKPLDLMFDEKFYIPAARNYLTGGGLLNLEHPPLGKWFIAGGISIFGDNPVGWRMPSVLFGVASIFIFYLICAQLCRKEVVSNGNKQSYFSLMTFVPVFATFLFAFENMIFIQANIGMLDVFYFTFMLAGFLFYLHGKYLASGIALGLSLLCKTPALLGIVAILVHWAVTRRHEITAEIRNILRPQGSKQRLQNFSTLADVAKLVIPVVIGWIVLLPLLEYPASRQLANPISRFVYMFGFHVNFTASEYNSPLATMPWTWLTTPTHIIYWPDSTHLKWIVDHWVLGIDSANPLYWASISWNIWILIIPSMLYLLYQIIRYHAGHCALATFVLSWFFGVYTLLIPIELITGRLMFTYYFYPAIPTVCLAIAWLSWKLWLYMKKNRPNRIIFLSGLSIYIVSTVIIFFFMSPFGGHFLFQA